MLSGLCELWLELFELVLVTTALVEVSTHKPPPGQASGAQVVTYHAKQFPGRCIKERNKNSTTSSSSKYIVTTTARIEAPTALGCVGGARVDVRPASPHGPKGKTRVSLRCVAGGPHQDELVPRACGEGLALLVHAQTRHPGGMPQPLGVGAGGAIAGQAQLVPL